MKKVKLEIDVLAVESFPIDALETEEGTVQAYDAPTPPYASCGCTTGASYYHAFCPPPSTATTCAEVERA